MKYIGIDLGTTLSVVGHLDDTGIPRPIKDGNGVLLIPSCVAMIQDKLEVGVGAKVHRGNVPDEGAARFKRDMGTEKAYSICGEETTPKDLSAMVLKHMKAIAEAELGTKLHAVVTIPANFSHGARDETMYAAKKAGLDVKYIINEPTAAALYYAYEGKKELHGTYAVYDLGGGTFDVSIIEVNGSEVDVIATNGVAKLGGVDFDSAVRDFVKNKFEEATGKKFDPEDFNDNDAEEAKITLSKRKRTSVQVGRDFIDIRREDFEEIISSQIAQTELLCETTLEEAKIGTSDIKEVFLAGGSTRIPAIRQSVEKIFGKLPISTADVDHVVALGAALYSAFKSDGKGLSRVQSKSLGVMNVLESTGMCFGTTVVSDNINKGEFERQNSVLIKKGEKIPVSVTKVFYTMHDDQRAVKCRINESRTPETNLKFVNEIWSGELKLPPNRPARQPIEVTFTYNENQMIEAKFKDIESEVMQEIQLSISGSSDSGKVSKFSI